MAATYRSTYTDDSDDEIVWNLSDSRKPRLPLPSSPSYSFVSDFSSDFVILSRPLSPVTHTQSRTAAGLQQHTPITATFNVSLTEQVAKLRISGSANGASQTKVKKAKPAQAGVLQNSENQPLKSTKKQGKKKAQQKPGRPTVAEDAYPSLSPKTTTKRKNDQHGNGSTTTRVKRTNLRSNKPVDNGNADVRPVVSTASQAAKAPSLYEEASTFISRFLSNPEAKKDSVCRLTLLQSLIIELGLATSNLPASLRAARAFLKARAFLNIREYIAVRSQGPDAIQRAMYPSRSALIKGFKKNKGSRASLQWVKSMGLQVLLVGWRH